eukprot:2621514-Rhodomonas_salina.1
MSVNDVVPMQAGGPYLQPPHCGAKRAADDAGDDGAKRQRPLPPVCGKRAAADAGDDGAKRQMMFAAAAVQAPATMYMPNSLYTIEEECAPVSYKRTHNVMQAGGRNLKRKQDEMLALRATFEPMTPRKHLVVDAMQLD